MKKRCLLAFALILAFGAASLATIQPGETREAIGVLERIDLKFRTVIIEVPTDKGSVTVGATLPQEVKALLSGKEAELSSLPLKHRARIRYTRVGDRLEVIRLEVFSK